MKPIDQALKIWLCGVLAFGATACGNAATSQPTEAQLSAISMFKGISALDVASRSRLVSTTAALSITQYYELVLNRVPAKPVVVAGYNLADAPGGLKARAGFYKTLAAAFPTVGAYWQATGYQPLSIFDQQTFLDSLTKSPSTAHAVGLVTQSGCDDSAITDPAKLPIVGSSVNGNTPQDQIAINYLNNYVAFMNTVKNQAAAPTSNATYQNKVNYGIGANQTYAVTQNADGSNWNNYSSTRWGKTGDCNMFTQQSYPIRVPGTVWNKLTNVSIDGNGTVTRSSASTAMHPDDAPVN